MNEININENNCDVATVNRVSVENQTGQTGKVNRRTEIH